MRVEGGGGGGGGGGGCVGGGGTYSGQLPHPWRGHNFSPRATPQARTLLVTIFTWSSVALLLTPCSQNTAQGPFGGPLRSRMVP